MGEMEQNSIVWTPLRHTKLLIVTGAADAITATQTSGQRGAEMLFDRKKESLTQYDWDCCLQRVAALHMDLTVSALSLICFYTRSVLADF
jgi:hypothetical protein